MKPDSSHSSEAAPVTGDLPTASGMGPLFEIADLPPPLPYNLRNLLRLIGPGAILLATSIGGGEWLVGPAQAVKHGASMLWLVPVAIIAQLAFNLEAIRYTLYTGEPIYGGILRLWPGPRIWGPLYCVLAFLQLCWPALALMCANTVFGMIHRQLPDDPSFDAGQVAAAAMTARYYALGLILLVLVILHFGGTVERMLEKASWFMLVFIFTFLLVVNICFVPIETWIENLKGFFGFLPRPDGAIDWGLLGALAATAGTGGIGNLTITNWMRDKGFGMGLLTGAIPSAVGSREVKLSQAGKVFPASGRNLQSWREWNRYVFADQVLVWALFCFLGMFLNVNLATGLMPKGVSIEGIAAGAKQAQYLVDKTHLQWLWHLTLLNGFWILFSTQLGNTDILVRTITDVLWLSSARVRARRGGIRGLYYLTLFVVSGFGIAALWSSSGADLFKILANMGGLVLAIAAVQVLVVNRRFLPRVLRPPVWRELLLLGCAAFYGFFAWRWIVSLVT